MRLRKGWGSPLCVQRSSSVPLPPRELVEGIQPPGHSAVSG